MFNSGWKALKNEWLSGPFKVDNYNATEKVLTLVPNDKWWGDKPLLDRVVYREIAEDAQAAAFANNEIDVFEVGVNADSFTRAKAVAGGAVRQSAGPDWRHITFNSTAGLLQGQGHPAGDRAGPGPGVDRRLRPCRHRGVRARAAEQPHPADQPGGV